MPNNDNLRVIKNRPPRLNERVEIGRYPNHDSINLINHIGVIGKCGLVAECERIEGEQAVKLYAARRRSRPQ